VSAYRRDLLKQGVHMLGVTCRERPTRVVGRKLGVANSGHALTSHRVALISNGEQGDGGVTEDQQVRSENSMRAWWAAVSRVSSRSSPLAVVNQAIMVGSVG
jgi:hypothetical protein